MRSIVWVFLLLLPYPLFSQHTGTTLIHLSPGKKIAPVLSLPATKNAFKNFRVKVKDKAAFIKWLNQHMPAVTVKMALTDESLLELSGVNSLQQLSNCPWITFIDMPNRIPREERELPNNDLSANKITLVHTHFPQIAGEGLVVSVKEKPFDKTDIDFKGRIVAMEEDSEPATTHATTMATIIAGGGNSAPTGKGVAWKSALTSSSYQELLPDDGQKLRSKGVSVQNHSYGVGIENYYGLESQAYDKHCMYYPDILHVFSSGNGSSGVSKEGSYKEITGFANLTGQFKMSKNTLSVGATDAFGQVSSLSSAGPAYDGRVKPELVAYGEGGSSESAALVSGICLLLQQAYRDQYTGELPPASLVKAVLVNTADDVGAPGPDFRTGYGMADATGAINTLLENRFFTSSIQENEESIFRVEVPAGNYALKVTLAWHDPEASPNAEKALVNDLDLEVVNPETGQRWKPWVLNAFPNAASLQLPARRRTDRLNNIEQVTIEFPQQGHYELHVKGYEVITKEQAFSLVYEVEKKEFSWLYPTHQTPLPSTQPTNIRWHWNGQPALGKLFYKSQHKEEWVLLDSSLNLSQLYFSWIPPDSVGLGQFGMQVNGQLILSDTFSMSPPLKINVDYACREEVMISWPKVPHVQQYQLFKLGETYLEPFMLSSDTVVVLDSLQKQVEEYAVAPVMNGIIGIRGSTVNYSKQGVDCYFLSFRTRELITDTVYLDLELSSTHRLLSAQLERWENGIFVPIQSVTPVQSKQIIFSDQHPLKGRNIYRVRLENNKKKTIYSGEEEVFYMRKGDLLVFPNPVSTGQSLSIIEAEDQSIVVRLYDNLGRLVYESEETGAVKTIATERLTKGFYIMLVRTESGEELMERIVVF